MQFYTKELWAEINLASKETRKQAEARWEYNDQAFTQYLESNKDKGVEQYLDLMGRYHGFHDYAVTAFYFDPESKEGTIDLCGSVWEVSVLFKGIESVSSDIRQITLHDGKMEWGYHEVFFAGDVVELSVCFDFFSEMSITAKEIFLRDEKGEVHPWFK